jgi:hypothetical protein
MGESIEVTFLTHTVVITHLQRSRYFDRITAVIAMRAQVDMHSTVDYY